MTEQSGPIRQRMTAKRVRTRSELAEFIDLAPRLAAQRDETDHYVPLFTSDIAAWFHRRGWFTDPIELWLLVDDDGRARARTICHQSSQLAAELSDSGPRSTLFFGAIEAEAPDDLEQLIEFITTRALEVSADRVFGPVSPLPNVTGGLLLSGTDHPGFFDTAWNPDFYARVFREAGFSTWGPAQTWEVEVGGIPAPRATAVTEAEWAHHGLRRRRVSRWRIGAFRRRLLPTLNSSFKALPYYTQIRPAQLRAQMQGLAALADPDLIIDIAGSGDPDDAPPRCFALVIPDPLPILRRHRGHLGAGAAVDLLTQRGRLRDAVLIIQGTDPAFQGQGLLSLAIRDLNANLVAHGYRRLRVTFIAEDNPASAAVFERCGGRPLHELAFLDRHLTTEARGR